MKKSLSNKEERFREVLVAMDLMKGNREFLNLFFKDLLTPHEYAEIGRRFEIVRRLASGETHRQVASALGIGVGTVNRGARMLQNKKGGFYLLFEKHKHFL